MEQKLFFCLYDTRHKFSFKSWREVESHLEDHRKFLGDQQLPPRQCPYWHEHQVPCLEYQLHKITCLFKV